jgi:alpha-N-arabinofuranosidase
MFGGGRLGRLLALTVLFACAPAAAEDWPRNGDFTQPGSPPAGWFVDPEGAAKGKIAVVAAPAGVAGQMLELSPNATNTPSAKPLSVGELLPASAFRGHDVEVSAQLGATGGARAVLGLTVLSKNGAGDSVQLRNATSDGSLGLQQDRVRVPDDPGLVGLVFFLAAEGTGGVARFATVTVRALGAAPAAHQAQSGAIGPDMPAQVRVDTARILRNIPRDLFGTNIEIIRNANGLWDAANQRLDPTLVKLARDLGITSIRFPGGVWADTYDWRKGIGPRIDRVATPTHPGATETMPNGFGTDEALEFAHAVGGHLLITVNAASDSPERAAEWVRYVNGDGGRAPRTGRVEDWEIGNESYIEGDLSGGHVSPQRYADRVIAYAGAMRAVDPSIRIGAIGLHNFGRYRLNAYDDWDEVVLRRAGPVIDRVMVHNAYAPVVGDGRGLDPADVYAALWAAPLLIGRNLQDTWREVESFAPADSARIRLGVTEWGPLYAIAPSSPYIDHVKTLGSAIFVADMLKVFAEDPHVAVANFFKLNEASFMGWIGRRGSVWEPTAPYYAFQMVSRGMQPELLASSVEVAQYDSRSVGFVDSVKGVPYLDALATTSADGRTVTVLLISKNATQAVSAHVVLTGSSGATVLHSETLTGAAPDANTGTELPRVPGLEWAAQKQFGPAGRFDHGGGGEVRLERASQESPGADLTVRVPPSSLMLLRFEGVVRH